MLFCVDAGKLSGGKKRPQYSAPNYGWRSGQLYYINDASHSDGQWDAITDNQYTDRIDKGVAGSFGYGCIFTCYHILSTLGTWVVFGRLIEQA
jgi:hypothetical protein